MAATTLRILSIIEKDCREASFLFFSRAGLRPHKAHLRQSEVLGKEVRLEN